MKQSYLAAFLVLSVACSKVQKIDKRTESMEKATTEVSATTESMKETTSIMYRQIRSKEAEDTREKKFQILMDDEADFGTRMNAAAVYFKSQEFQLWSYSEIESDDLKAYYLDAANEFTRRMIDLSERINPKKLSPIRPNKMEMSFLALSVTMHMNHHFQEEAVKLKNQPTVSFYDLIKKALMKEKEAKTLLAHEEVLLNGHNREVLIDLVKARVDMFSAMALDNLTDKDNMTLKQKTKALVFKITGGRLGSIDLPETYEKCNEATKVFVEKYLDQALKAKLFLREIGVEKSLDKTLKAAFKEIDLNERSPKDSSDQRRNNLKNLIKGLIN